MLNIGPKSCSMPVSSPSVASTTSSISFALYFLLVYYYCPTDLSLCISEVGLLIQLRIIEAAATIRRCNHGTQRDMRLIAQNCPHAPSQLT
jgi:hypothetical protein